MKSFLISISFIFSLACLHAQKISDTVVLSDGRTVTTDYVFYEGDIATFSLEDASESVFWELLFVPNDFYEQDAEEFPERYSIQTSSKDNKLVFHVDDDYLENIEKIDLYWSGFKQYPEYESRNVYYKALLRIRDENTILDCKELIFNLAPSIPMLKSDDFSYVWDWEYDAIYPNGLLTLMVGFNRCDHIIFHISTRDYLFSKQDISGFHAHIYDVQSKENPITIKYSDMDWGAYFYIRAVGKYGYALSDTINVNDYITEPEILAQIEKYNPYSAIDDVQADNEKFKISTYGNGIKIAGDINQIISIKLYDISGRLCDSRYPADWIDISNLKRGFYIVALELRSGTLFTSKIIKP